MVAAINDEGAIMIVIDRDGPWILELAWLVAFLAELGHERESIIDTRQYLYSVVAGIGDEQEASMRIERQASRCVEQAISMALLLGADRELDSIITIIINKRTTHLQVRALNDNGDVLPDLQASKQEMKLTRLATDSNEESEQRSNEATTDRRRNEEQHLQHTPTHPLTHIKRKRAREWEYSLKRLLIEHACIRERERDQLHQESRLTCSRDAVHVEEGRGIS